MCFGILIDTMLIMVLAKLLTGQEVEDSWFKPLVVAILASAGSAGALAFAETQPDYLLLILGIAVLSLGVLVTIGCWLIMNVEFGKSALIGLIFMVVKIAFFAFLFLVLVAAG